MAIIILCSWSPSPKHHHDLYDHRRDTLISMVASLSSCQLLLLRLSLPLSDKVKQLHADCIAYNKATTIWLLPIADNFVTKHDHLIQQFISHHAFTILHHCKPCKNKLDVLYFVVASFMWLLWASSKNRSYLRIKTTTIFRQVHYFNLQQGSIVVKLDSTKVGQTDTRQPPLCKSASVEPVSWTQSCNVSPGRFIQQYHQIKVRH